jgi:WD40 repeat protein
VLGTAYPVWCLDWSGDGRLLAAGGEGGEAAVWSRGGGRVAGLEGHTETVHAIQFSGSGRLVATASDTQTCRVWEADTGTCRQVVRPPGSVFAVAWGAGEHLFLAAGHTVLHFLVGADRPVEAYTGHTDTVLSLAWDPRGGLLASGSQDGTVRTWRPDSASPARATLITDHRIRVQEVVWRPGLPGILASWDESPGVRIWDTEAGSGLLTLPCAPGGGYGYLAGKISFSPDGQLVAARGGEVRVWRAETGELALVCRVEGQAVSWSPGGDRLAVTTQGKDGRFSDILVFGLSLSLKSLSAQAVASCLRGREQVAGLDIPQTIKEEIQLLL